MLLTIIVCKWQKILLQDSPTWAAVWRGRESSTRGRCWRWKWSAGRWEILFSSERNILQPPWLQWWSSSHKVHSNMERWVQDTTWRHSLPFSFTKRYRGPNFYFQTMWSLNEKSFSIRMKLTTLVQFHDSFKTFLNVCYICFPASISLHLLFCLTC